MCRVVELMLLTCGLWIAPGCVDVGTATGPDRAGAVSSQSGSGAEAQAPDADPEASPLPAPDKATGELTHGERQFQGAWQLNAYDSDAPLGTLRIVDRDFHADGVHGWYEGYVSIRSDTTPSQIDFTIEDCDGNYKGMTSAGIYYEEDGGAIVFAGPEPGAPRPEAFNEPNEMWRMRPIEPATADDGEKSR